MTELRQRMIACLPRQGLAERAQKMSVRAVRQLAEDSHQAPDLITEEALRQYFLYIKHVKKYSRSASTMTLSGIQFCCAHTLHSDWTTLRLVRAPREQQLSVILSFAVDIMPGEPTMQELGGTLRATSHAYCPW